MSAHVDHCRTHVIKYSECTCDLPAPQPDPEVLLCTTPTFTGTVWHQGEDTPAPTAPATTLTQLADKLDQAVRTYSECQLRDTAEEVEQALRARAVPNAPVCVTDHPTGAQLDALAPGRRVVDATGDMWFKLHDGRWSFKNMTTSSAVHLVDVWGPVRILPEVAE